MYGTAAMIGIGTFGGLFLIYKLMNKTGQQNIQQPEKKQETQFSKEFETEIKAISDPKELREENGVLKKEVFLRLYYLMTREIACKMKEVKEEMRVKRR